MKLINKTFVAFMKIKMHLFTKKNLITKMRLNIPMLNFDLNLMMHSIDVAAKNINAKCGDSLVAC